MMADVIMLEDFIQYQCQERDAKVSRWRLIQGVRDILFGEESFDYDPNMIFTGSVNEGLPEKVCSDRDYMTVSKQYPIVVHQQPTVSPPQGFLIYTINTSCPAYMTLKTQPGMKYHFNIQGSILESGKDGYLSSTKFVTSEFQGSSDIEINGPAGATVLNPWRPERGKQDIVPCLSMPTWPPHASEFLSRHRNHGWPPQSLIDKIQQAGCHVVPIGHPQSLNKDLEWRCSFSIAERELIHCINDKMFSVMYILKALKSRHMLHADDTLSSSISSYFIKTACLWICEETDQSGSGIMDLCYKVLDWLVTFYRRQRLPHYFIPQQNLIGHLSIASSNKVASQLDAIKDDHLRFVALYFQELQLDSSDFDLGVTVTSQDSIFPSVKNWSGSVTAQTALQTITLCNPLKEQRNRTITAVYSNLSDMNIVDCAINNAIKKGTPASKVASFPEVIRTKVLSDFQNIVSSVYTNVFMIAIERFLGELYMGLSAKYKYKDLKRHKATIDTCNQRVIHYFTQGMEMIHPDGWSDRGLGGYVRLATFYHLNGEREKLEETLEKLEPLLEWGKNADTISCVGYIVVKRYEPLSIVSWMQDELLYKNAINTSNDRCQYINVVILGYYVLIRSSVGSIHHDQNTSDIKQKVKDYISHIEEIVTRGKLLPTQDKNLHTIEQQESAERILQLSRTILQFRTRIYRGTLEKIVRESFCF